MDKLASQGPAISLGTDTKQIVCDKCGMDIFEQGFLLREVPAIMTGTGKPGIIPIPVFMCMNCGHVNAQFVPEELKQNGNSGKETSIQL